LNEESKVMSRLQGKVALITGAARGMGESHARRFIAEGAKVILTDLREDAGAALAAKLGKDALFLRHDVATAVDWATVIQKGEAAFGPITVLVNNAGVLGPVARTGEISETDYLKVCAINQTSVFFGMKAVLPSMLKAGIGSIVNISSAAGIAAIYGFPSVAYVASKFAVRGMTKAAAIEYGAKNIRVNSVHPGFIETPMMVEATDEKGGEAIGLIPLRRVAKPNEVANLVLFLASDESSFITGTEQIIDGGMLAQ
jgi:3alpha(or 20beta)-hydroxysteroid dehydrogenase